MFSTNKFMGALRAQIKEKERIQKNKKRYPVKMPETLYLEAKNRALGLGLSLNAYFNRLVEKDIQEEVLKKF